MSNKVKTFPADQRYPASGRKSTISLFNNTLLWILQEKKKIDPGVLFSAFRNLSVATNYQVSKHETFWLK